MTKPRRVRSGTGRSGASEASHKNWGELSKEAFTSELFSSSRSFLSNPIQKDLINESECANEIHFLLFFGAGALPDRIQSEANKHSAPWAWLADVALLNIKLTAFLNSIVQSGKNPEALTVLRETAKVVPYWAVLARHRDPELVESVLSKLELAEYGPFKKMAGYKLSTPINRFCWQVVREIRYLRSLAPKDLAATWTIAAISRRLTH